MNFFFFFLTTWRRFYFFPPFPETSFIVFKMESKQVQVDSDSKPEENTSILDEPICRYILLSKNLLTHITVSPPAYTHGFGGFIGFNVLRSHTVKL